MGVEDLRPARYWRKRAEQFRAKAHNAQLGETRQRLLEIARRYDALAHRAEIGALTSRSADHQAMRVDA